MIYEYSANRPARAKINLMLSVVGRMPNGYHELKSVMHAVPLRDDVIVELAVRTGKDAETAAGATAEQAAPAAGAFAQVAPAAGAFAQVAPAAGAPAVGAPAAMATVAMLAAAAPEAGGASGAGPALAATAPAPAPAAAVAADAAAFADCAYSAPIYARIALTAEYDAHGPGGASTEWAHEPSRAAARDGNGDREHGNAHNGMCNDAHGNMCSDAHGDVRNGSHNGAHCNPRIGAHGNPRTDAYSGPHQALFADIPTDGRNSAVKATRLFLEHCGIKTVRVADEPTSELHAAPLGEPTAAPRTPKTCTKTDATPQPFAPRQPICLDIHIRIVKRIPAAAGLAGGSSDAAATLLALNEIFQSAGMPGATATELMDIAKSVGADVPFCLAGWPAALARGIGEKLEPLPPLPPCVSVVLANPNLPVETAWVFSRYSQRPAKDTRETRATSASGTTDATNADSAPNIPSATDATDSDLASDSASDLASDADSGLTSDSEPASDADSASDSTTDSDSNLATASAPDLASDADSGLASDSDPASDSDILALALKNRPANFFASARSGMFNDLEAVTARAHPAIGELKELMLRHGAEAALMSGSGATVFGLFSSPEQAAGAQKDASGKGFWTTLW